MVFNASTWAGDAPLVGKHHEGLVEIRQVNRKALHRGVELVFDLYADRVARGVVLVIESGGGLERTVLIEREEGIVSVACSPTHQGVGQDCGFASGSVALDHHHRTDRLVLGDGEERQEARSVGGMADLPIGRRNPM